MLDDRSYMREPDWRPAAAQGGISLCLTLIIANVICYVLQHTVRGFEGALALFPQRLQEGYIGIVKLSVFAWRTVSFADQLRDDLVCWTAN